MAAQPRDPGWAEWFIPSQILELSCVEIEEPRKLTGPGVPAYAADRLIAPISYRTPISSLPCLTLLTPFLRVRFWDSPSGRLELELDPDSPFSTKLIALQEYILSLLGAHLTWLPPDQRSVQDIYPNFQTLVHNGNCTVYLHGPNPERKQMGRVWCYQNSGWQKGVGQHSFQKGQQIRLALRIQGICFLQTASGRQRYRIQHQVIAIFHESTQRR
jgi:hypothetical protein